MRLTRELITRSIDTLLTRRTESRHDLLAAYLCGTFLGDNYLLGGTGDVDLVFVYNGKPEAEREILPIVEDVHLDICNRDESDFRDTRVLRVDPWLGPEINACKILYDPQHFLDFIQASVRGQFDRPDHVYQRARSFLDQARSTWFQLVDESDQASQAQMTASYLQAVGMAVNAAASLNGPPLPERRLMLDFSQRAEEIGQPGLFQGLLGLLGAADLTEAAVSDWVVSWEKAFCSIPEANRPVKLQLARLRYYLGAFDGIIDSGQIYGTLWMLLETWSQIAALLPGNSEHWAAWRREFDTLGFNQPAFGGRIAALDALLDTVEEVLETWGRENGV